MSEIRDEYLTELIESTSLFNISEEFISEAVVYFEYDEPKMITPKEFKLFMKQPLLFKHLLITEVKVKLDLDLLKKTIITISEFILM
jgi:hypothetical protein